MTLAQQRAINEYRFRDLAGLGDVRPITSAVGSGLYATAGIVAAIPGGQLPGAIIAATGALTSLIGGLFKPDLTKIEATHIVDDIEARVMKPTVASWQALPADQKTVSMQAAYLKVIDDGLAAVEQGCSNPALGSAGQACINDRLRTGRWPWPVYYRDPIANDPNVLPDPVAAIPDVSDTVSSWFGGPAGGGSDGGGGFPIPLLIGAALLLFAFSMD